MNAALTALDDGWTAGHYDWSDAFLIVGTVLAVFAAIAYGSVARRRLPGEPAVGWHHWAAALLALGVACTAFALFLL